MKKQTKLKVIFSSILLLFTNMVFAGEMVPYNQKDFVNNLEMGKPVALDFFASWCSTCKKQSAVLQEILKDDKYKDYIIYVVDYDNSQEEKDFYNIRTQSTIIVFNKTEKSRSIGITKEDGLRQELDKGLN